MVRETTRRWVSCTLRVTSVAGLTMGFAATAGAMAATTKPRSPPANLKGRATGSSAFSQEGIMPEA